MPQKSGIEIEFSYSWNWIQKDQKCIKSEAWNCKISKEETNRIERIEQGPWNGGPNYLDVYKVHGDPQLDVGSAKRVINCGFQLV